MDQPKTLEEGMASLAALLGDEALDAAVAGEFGPEIRLLTLSEKTRRTSKAKAS